MATPIENLKRGDYVAIVDCKSEAAKKILINWTGEPLRIKNFSLPFVAVENFSGKVFGVDVRMYDLQKLSRGYVGTMRAASLSKLDDLKPNEQNVVQSILTHAKK